jgi:hypothetical protein
VHGTWPQPRKGRKKREGKRGGGALLGFGKEKERDKKRERWFRGGEKRAWCHAMT